MKTLEQLKDAMVDLQRRRAALQQEMNAFDALQREIADLRQRSPADGNARRKLERLDVLMKNGGQHLVDQVVSQAGKAERCMQKIDEEFQKLAARTDEPPREMRQAGRLRRVFV
ncbi:hypothetical protein [Burkholderia ubonensis]|uniref:hypothetical protein n=1 Tax=Burkholderia ubonensis TaxID=101571 RepID=UPI00075A942B|nr:hypothetical protein [Burkholderia ubonensis]KVX77020.1 hypothetical protein WL08_15260 [Burkholderia ubonensis]